MIQNLLAVIIVAWFLSRLFWQKKKGQINKSEFIFWLLFWLIALALVLALKWLDKLVAGLGFSSTGIQVLLYLAVAVLTYFIFRIRLRLSKMEKDITKIVEHLAINKK
jgi:hypothetical protein